MARRQLTMTELMGAVADESLPACATKSGLPHVSLIHRNKPWMSINISNDFPLGFVRCGISQCAREFQCVAAAYALLHVVIAHARR